MIQLSSSTVFVLHDDATSEPIDTEELQTKIIRACIAAGETDSWIAGDIALAAEYALLGSEKRMVRDHELDSLVLCALEDAGYPHVAAEYKRASAAARPAVLPANVSAVRELLRTNAAIPKERLERVAARTVRALELLGLPEASMGLILELARQFRDGDLSAVSLPKTEVHNPRTGGGAILLRQSELMQEVSPETASLLRSHALRMFHISRLFTVLRIEISLSAFAELTGLAKPVTELAFWAAAGNLTRAIDEICAVSDRFCAMRGEDSGRLSVPLCLSVRDTLPFACNYMNCPAPGARDCVQGLIATFAASLKRPPFKISIL